MFRRSTLSIILIFLVLSSKTASAEWLWVQQNTYDKIIIFVHGLRGDPKTSFTKAGSKHSWPELMASDTLEVRGAPALSKYSIALLGYPAGRGDRLNIQEIAYRLLIEMDDGALLAPYKHVIFVTHSLGGLVAKDMILTAQKDKNPLPSKVAAVFLVSVPSKGSPAAEWVDKFLSEPLLQDLKPMNVNSYLQTIDTDWERLLRNRERNGKPRIFCAYELLPTPTVPPAPAIHVVPEIFTSTTCDERPWPENKDHFDMVKPDTTNHPVYTWVRGRISSLYRGVFESKSPAPPVTPEPKLTPEPKKAKEEQKGDPQEEGKPNGQRADVTRRAYSSLLRYVRTITVTTSRWKENIGKNLGDIYTSGRSPKAMAVCVDWQSSTPDRVVGKRAHMDYSTRVDRTVGEARTYSLEMCNAWRVQAEARCECVHVDVNGESVLDPPDWWIKKYSR